MQRKLQAGKDTVSAQGLGFAANLRGRRYYILVLVLVSGLRD